MRSEVILLRICYWWGIVADGITVFLMLFPSLYLRFMNLNLTPDPGFCYGLITGAPVMFGWTALLFWADRKPVERKDILLLTFPVLVGYILVGGYSLFTGLAPLGSVLPLLTMLTGLGVFITFSLLKVRNLGL